MALGVTTHPLDEKTMFRLKVIFYTVGVAQ